MMVVAIVSGFVLLFQDIKTQTVHLIPLSIFIVSMMFNYGLKRFDLTLGITIVMMSVLLIGYEKYKKKTYLGCGDILMITAYSLFLDIMTFTSVMFLSSTLTLLFMLVLKQKKLAFIPALILSLWGHMIYEIII